MEGRRVPPRRIVVIGTSGSGKTTLADLLAGRFGLPHIELDGLHWEPNWTEAATPIFRQRVAAAVAGDAWIVDGNYSKARDLIWPRADTIVWLDYPLWLILWRLLRRTSRRVLWREPLWNGNRERLLAQIASRDSIFLWVLQTYGRRRREFPALLSSPEHAHLRVVRHRSPRDTHLWVEQVTSVLVSPDPVQR
jgi:adenylate kinase family enzyme